MRRLMLLLSLSLAGCASFETYPPAVPAPATMQQEVLVPLGTPLPVPQPDPVEGASPPRTAVVPIIERPMTVQASYATPPPLSPPPRPGKKAAVTTEGIIKEAHAASVQEPTAAGYAPGSALQTYAYQPGRIYTLISSPTQPSVIQLPQGERLVAPPPLNGEEWEVGMAEMTVGRRQESILLRPMKAGLSARTILLCASGNAYVVALRSTPGTSMVGITWTLPEAYRPAVSVEGASPPRTALETTKGMRPIIEGPLVGTARRFEGYTVSTVKGNPPWLPTHVWDDGSVTVLEFAESLTFGQAPIVLALGPDGSPRIVSTVTHDPGTLHAPAHYVVGGLHPVLILRDGLGMEARIVRKEVAQAGDQGFVPPRRQ